MVPEATGYLMTLGLKPDEAEIYLDLLSSGPIRVEKLAEDTGRELGEACRLLAALTAVGLVGAVDGPGSPVSALRPEPVLEVLSRQRETELVRARLAMTRLYEQFRRPVREDTGPMIETVSGAAAAERVRQLERAARHEVRGLDSPPYYADADANEIELENLGRGVRYRAVYGRLAVERAEYVAENILPCGKRGEEARVLPEVPVKLLIVDDDCAALSGADRTVLLIRPGGLLDALTGLFDMCWQMALPLGLSSDGEGAPIRPSERRLLGLLAAGLTDDQAARVLGVSRRTMFRYLENLMARTGAANRFQLALHATRNDWLPVAAEPGQAPVRSVPS
ncbi:helix-turn-helix domain-containing protein [Amycolatopsis benzoatilytica]|uniref:helix-turn-helix domain-containing protein n=1 Tax=Amycolatopsis benzoatilytica TaxID=346045 RepID=UPI00036F1892|nr:helix-turn-helix domain-containing protein [Amycolatopsis benzoatilytica]